MRLTPLAKAFIVAVVVLVIGVATWYYKGSAIKEWAGGERASGGDSKGDFDNLKGGPGDPARNAGSTGVSAVAIGTGKLSRPLVVGINTWAGHSPGIVFKVVWAKSGLVGQEEIWDRCEVRAAGRSGR